MAKGCTPTRAARAITLFCNVCFILLGFSILIFAIVGYQKASSFRSNTDIASSLDLSLLAVIVLAAGGATMSLGLIGCYGAYRKSVMVLKMYVVLSLCILITQLIIAIYLMSLSMSKLRLAWEESTPTGYNRRVDLQNYMSCCGFDSWTDSLGSLHTNCPFLPTYPDYIEPQTCKDAILAFIERWIIPMAVAAIVIASVEFVTVIVSLYLILDPKSRAAEFTG